MFRYYLLGGDTAMPGGLYSRFCDAFLVMNFFNIFINVSEWYAVVSVACKRLKLSEIYKHRIVGL